MSRQAKRYAEPHITDIDNHSRDHVGLSIAAAFLELDERTVRNRFDDHLLEGYRDGKVYRISVASLKAYDLGRRGQRSMWNHASSASST